MRYHLAQVNIRTPGVVWRLQTWVRAGLIPTVDAALYRLEMLKARGPSPDTFTSRQLLRRRIKTSPGGRVSA